MKRRRTQRAGAIALLLAGGLIAGCGPAAVPDSVVQVQAQWLCDVTRYAYTDATGMTQRLEELLAEAGVSADAYAEFAMRVDGDAAVRAQISAAYDARCGATP